MRLLRFSISRFSGETLTLTRFRIHRDSIDHPPLCPAYPDIPVVHSRSSRVPLGRERWYLRHRVRSLCRANVWSSCSRRCCARTPKKPITTVLHGGARTAKMEVALTPRYSRVARQRYRYIPVFCTVTTVALPPRRSSPSCQRDRHILYLGQT